MMKIALFPGTFDPPTLGHLEIIQQASALFDKVYIAVMKDSVKQSQSLSLKDRMELLRTMTSDINSVVVTELSGLVVDCAKHHNAQYLVRGLRNGTDFDFEYAMATTNRQIAGIETVVFFSSPHYAHIHSTLIREIAYQGHPLNGLVPASIVGSVSKKMSQKKCE